MSSKCRTSEDHGGYFGQGGEAEKQELRPRATPRWRRCLSAAWQVPPPPAGRPHHRAPSAPCLGLPGPAGLSYPSCGLSQAAAPSPGDRLARVRPAAAARARPLLPR